MSTMFIANENKYSKWIDQNSNPDLLSTINVW